MSFLNHTHNSESARDKRTSIRIYRRISKVGHGVSCVGQNILSRSAKPVALMFLALIICFSLFFNTQLCYAIKVDGETIGTTRDKTDADELVASAERQASQIFGYDYSLENMVSVSAWIGSDSTEDLGEAAILERIEGITKLNVLYVDGRPVGAAEDSSELADILDDILDKYTTESTASAGFAQEVSIRYTFVEKDILQDISELSCLLDPENESSDFSLDVETVEITNRVKKIEYDTEYCNDNTIYELTEEVTTEGSDGEALVTEQKSLMNGIETQHEVLSELIIKEPTKKIIAVGTKERPATASWGEYEWPCSGVITSLFGYRSARVGSSNHQGIDIANARGTEIYAADGGEVTFAENTKGYGKLIKITHDNGDMTFYGHCSKLLVSAGSRVAQGQLIALMGTTGISTGTHLHFEIRPSGNEPANPMDYLPEDSCREINEN